MLWLNAISLMALGITTATRNFSTGALAALVPQALKTSESAITRVKNHANFFIFSPYLMDGYDSLLRDSWFCFESYSYTVGSCTSSSILPFEGLCQRRWGADSGDSRHQY